jgi:hypothetical protein
MKRKEFVLTSVTVVVLVFVLAVLGGWAPWSRKLTRDDAREAIRKAAPRARIEDGPEVDGAKTLLAHVVEGGYKEDVLVAIASQQNGAFDPLKAAERLSGRGWGGEASCKNFAVAYRTTGKSGDGFGVDAHVERAITDATPDGARDCQG